VLDLERVDLAGLCEALEDHSYDSQWWLDPRTGEVEYRPESFLADDDADHEEGGEHPETRGLVLIEPLPSHESYGDMEDFIARIRDPRPRELLDRAIQGRGAFRRFKDTLYEFPELREAWFRFHDVRMERRALEWLRDEGLVDAAAAERAARERPDPDLPLLSGPFDPRAIAERAAGDLRSLYGARLRKVVLSGSWARGDAHLESDIHLVVVLDRVDSPWDELRRMDDVLWEHSVANGTLVSARPVAESVLDERGSPPIDRALSDGVPVG
jgi:predicted nucleotidyltransferase